MEVLGQMEVSLSSSSFTNEAVVRYWVRPPYLFMEIDIAFMSIGATVDDFVYGDRIRGDGS